MEVKLNSIVKVMLPRSFRAAIGNVDPGQNPQHFYLKSFALLTANVQAEDSTSSVPIESARRREAKVAGVDKWVCPS